MMMNSMSGNLSVFAGRKTRARKYKKLGWKYTMMEPAVCVSLLGSATPLAVIACSGNWPKVARYAKVTGGCDSKTSSWAADHDV